MKAIEALLWSIALPGFGQLLNKKYVKGIALIFLELLINTQSRFNEAIRLSFLGRTDEAAAMVDIGWLMFYPCLYFFAIWDAFKDAGGGQTPYSFLPFVFSAYSVTVGLMYSFDVKVAGVFFGPIWLPILSVIPGWAVGRLLQVVLLKWRRPSAP
ncbi:hypothetical protein [Geobacillus sp. C56-T2]|uniref:hypothetical protein n=1 Tax=Geobacillus sp. C56-T2 TaxID=600773 RepID=UPI0011A2F767|nr:hypothetical protein [Geobacillus sp. C56-T2]NNV06751.1 hypothetical protein [Geobacillus sp. MMMUD3]TWG29545.1 hypothetical protein GC56T2_0628 [Geobacillus sp. C56-T2]